MNVRISEAVWTLVRPRVSGGELLVLLALADMAGGDGWCWPSMATLAVRARLSERQARTHVRGLEKKGLIECPSTKGGKSVSNRYRLTIGGTETRKPTSKNYGRSNLGTRKITTEYGLAPKAEVSDAKGGNPLPRNRKEPSRGEGGNYHDVVHHHHQCSRAQGELVGDGSAGAREAGVDPTAIYYQIRDAAGVPNETDPARQASLGMAFASFHLATRLMSWRSLGLSDDVIVECIALVTASRRGKPPASPSYFNEPLRRLAGEREAAATPLAPIAPRAGFTSD
ncbi:Helix-turn-helix domain-containing protein [Albimonas donghaensis]|uniref:Helix-turn-helix domain-containing protein n=1 Tax=Albimonas donghaensis TaxID=356660 RepID=A0A1H3DTT0_9RHOB|nr:helix-turn-helix domain-containing protein [Albimonas donghaensis]SDX69518.1 Helix-turn-helix domain-containing protein [Albimonas donghaensis]